MEDLVNKLNLELKEKNSVLDESNSKASQLVKEITERDLEMETLQSRLDSVMIENAQVAIIKQENDEIRAKLDTERREFALKSDSLKREYTNKFEDAERTWQAEFDRMTASLKTSQEELLGLRTIAEVLLFGIYLIIRNLVMTLRDTRGLSNNYVKISRMLETPLISLLQPVVTPSRLLAAAYRILQRVVVNLVRVERAM